ncbi:TPA: hypothetical protein ACGBIO_002331 [Providencia rettgeri]
MSNDENEARQFILNYVKQMGMNVGHALFAPNFNSKVITSNLTPKAKEVMVTELEKLIGSGIFETTSDGRILLTEDGYNLIY